MNRPITADEVEAVIKKFPTHKRRGPDGFAGEFYKSLNEELTLSFTDYLKTSKLMEDSQTLFMKPASSYSQNQIKTQLRKKTSGQYR